MDKNNSMDQTQHIWSLDSTQAALCELWETADASRGIQAWICCSLTASRGDHFTSQSLGTEIQSAAEATK